MLVRQKTYEENNAKLYMVGVPIGNYDDMSYRAVETLKNVDIIFCEDTRVTLKLLTYFNISLALPCKYSSYFLVSSLAKHILRVGINSEIISNVSFMR